jgi:hypothetical protein
MFEWAIEAIKGILESQLPVPQALIGVHWWIGAILVALTGLGGLIVVLWSFIDSDLGVPGIIVGVIIFFLLTWVVGVGGIYWFPLALLIFLVVRWNTHWRFTGWRKF